MSLTPHPSADWLLRRKAELEGRAMDAPLSAFEPESKDRVKDPRVEARDWRAEQNECRKVFVALGCRVFWLSQARRTGQTPGLGDLFVFAPRIGRAWWWETKHGAGELTTAQEEFRQLCERTATLHGSGTAADAEQFAIDVGLAVRDTSGSLELTGRGGR